MNIAERLCGWTPFRAAYRGDAMWVDWCHLGPRRMTEPFQFETILEAMREPFNLAFQQSTPIDALAELPRGVPVSGLIFHMSRCGSTLVSQALAAMDSTIVVSEAAPLRAVLRAAAVGRATPAQAQTWLAGLVNAYAQPRFSDEQRVVVKFMAADVLDVALVRRAFPDVPWIFTTRDPAEILASHARNGGVDLKRGQIPAPRLGLDDEAMWRMDPKAYQAHVLAAFATAGLEGQALGQGLVFDYTDLPAALWTKLPAHFGLDVDAQTVELIRAATRRHSKAPGTAFVPDREAHRAGAEPFRPIAAAIAGPVMAALDALRRPA